MVAKMMQHPFIEYNRFTLNNTEGYGKADLDALNEAFDYLANERYLDPDLYDIKSWHDHIAERLLARYDNGDRGFKLRRSV